ncbi:unnamed protein product [Orchesella dallaii]|uniref:Reverse transcriptase domain-containing protein n=1 Tax=Orchesella dallaii TaxID=48710 RepID=A0ABP1Q2K7_9HEXA
MDSSDSKTSLRSVINQVTKEKLSWLDSQRRLLKTHFAAVLENYEKPENKSSLKFLKEIHTTLKSCSIITQDEDPEIANQIKDLSVFLNWIEVDAPNAVVYFGSEHLVRHWIETLIRNIKFKIERCEYSCLYANVMTQYMDVNSEEVELEVADKSKSSEGSQSTKEETMKEFSERIFTPHVDYKAEEFQRFLDKDLFDMDDFNHKRILNNIRTENEEFSKRLPHTSVSLEDIKLCIDGLLAEDLLGAEKAVTLKELKDNEDALNEVCTLLKNRIQNYSQWSWPEAVSVDFRRNMAGRYRAYMDEDIITAIFLHYLGAQWSIQLKTCFKRVYSSKIWKRGTGTSGDLYYRPQSIEGYRREFHGKSFLSMLPDSMADLAANAQIYDEDDNKNENSNDTTPMKIKQKLLHIISNEIQLNNALRPESPLTVVQTDMEWFGPSLVHEAIIAVMEFFGVTNNWLQFFKKFLESPLKVGSAEAPVQIRRRGVPISHILSSLSGESILFIMDLYVNQVSGLSVYRIHDDFWFWSHNTENVKKAWSSMNSFVKIAGLKLNEEKSASIVCKHGSDETSKILGPEPLPQVAVKWGFIVLHSDGKFRISQEMLEPHIKEMRECLQKSTTIMKWVHCHNRYIRFFIRNFAEPAQTFGKQHVVQIMKTLQSIFNEVHKEVGGDPVKALKKKFESIWENKDVMDSWVHWPVREGGLGLYNPFLEFIPLHETYRKQEERDSKLRSSNQIFCSVLDQDKNEWERILEESKKRGSKRKVHDKTEEVEEGTVTDLEASDGEADDDEDDFKSQGKKKRGKHLKRIAFKSWCDRYRETRWKRWRNCYCILLKNVGAATPQDSDADNWRECMYGSQLNAKFGHDSFINTNLIPLSLISSMQSARVHNN